jgi:hypothetical protein
MVIMWMLGKISKGCFINGLLYLSAQQKNAALRDCYETVENPVASRPGGEFYKNG